MKVTIEVIEGPNAGHRFEFARRDRFLVGRSAEAHLCVSRDRFFSRNHFMVEVNPPNVLLVDLRSTNGTYVNSSSRRVEEAMLEDGDVVLGGKTKLRVRIEDEVGPAGAGSPGGDRAEVRCQRCGRPAERERARSSAEAVSFLCPSCQDSMRDTPVLPAGYRAIRELGRGAMGSVYLAEASDGSRRAVKLVMPNAALSKRAREQFVTEARAQAKLVHPRIVRIFEVCEPETGLFAVVMEHVEGSSLSRRLAAQPKLERREAVSIALGMLEGLSYAHGVGVVHRDLKPSNVLVGRESSGSALVKLADFGLAQTYAETGASGFARLGDLDEALRYKPPEQIINFRQVEPAADLYAVGAIVYRMLSGELPHDLAPGRDPLLALLEDDVIPLGRRDPAIPSALAEVVERALRKQPADRWPSADEMRAALARTDEAH